MRWLAELLRVTVESTTQLGSEEERDSYRQVGGAVSSRDDEVAGGGGQVGSLAV